MSAFQRQQLRAEKWERESQEWARQSSAFCCSNCCKMLFGRLLIVLPLCMFRFRDCPRTKVSNTRLAGRMRPGPIARQLRCKTPACSVPRQLSWMLPVNAFSYSRGMFSIDDLDWEASHCDRTRCLATVFLGFWSPSFTHPQRESSRWSTYAAAKVRKETLKKTLTGNMVTQGMTSCDFVGLGCHISHSFFYDSCVISVRERG